MRIKLSFLSMLGVAILFMTGLMAINSDAASQAVHPDLSEQEKLIPCQQCHEKVTPKLHKEWYQSKHGLAMVKCYQCHGSFENFRLTPPLKACDSCHNKMVEKCPTNKQCWECHSPHRFEEHK